MVILLIEQPTLTLADVPRLLRDEGYRSRYTDELRNTGSRQFWEFDYNGLSPAKQMTESAPLLTRVDELLTEDVIRNILCQPRTTLDLRGLIEERKSLFVTLPVNEDAYTRSAGIIGVMLMSLVYATTFSFADIRDESQRPGFSLIVDEFQNFSTDEYAALFSQGRKYKVKQFLAHQYRGQLGDSANDANKDATLSAFTKIVFRVTEPDSRALASLFIDLEARRQPGNIAIDVINKLEKHPSPQVKEFARKYIWPLQEGTKDKVGTRRRFSWTFFQEDPSGPAYNPYKRIDEEVSYAYWCELMKKADGVFWDAKTSREKDRVIQQTQSPKEGRDFQLVPDYPKRDFGAGEVTFNPVWAQTALELLNQLLYDAQQNRIGFDTPDQTQVSAAQVRHAQTNARTAVALRGQLVLMLRFDDWVDAAAAVKSESEYQQVLANAQRGQPRAVAESFLRLLTWENALRDCLEVLIREPITQGATGVQRTDVSISLQRLPLQQAYILIGDQPYVMKTQPLTAGVDSAEEQRRRKQLRKQTRKSLCRHVRETQDEVATTAPDTLQAPREPVVTQSAPQIRRSRPLQ
jgi:hypothetical protein